MKCLSRLLFNVHAEAADERVEKELQNKAQAEKETDQSINQEQSQVAAIAAARPNEAATLVAFEQVAKSGCSLGKSHFANKVPSLVEFESESSFSVVAIERETTDENDDDDDDWILLEHWTTTQTRPARQQQNIVASKESPAALLSQQTQKEERNEKARGSKEEEEEEVAACDHHCHRQQHSSTTQQDPLQKQQSHLIEPNCRPALDCIVVDEDRVWCRRRKRRNKLTTQLHSTTKQSTPQIDHENTGNSNLDSTHPKTKSTNIYRTQNHNKERQLDAPKQTSVNLPATRTTETTVAMDNTDIELIKASWKPARKDPVAAGALLFKGLFTKFPQYLKFFTQFTDLDLEHIQDNKRLLKHALKVIDTVTYVVDAIGDDTQSGQLNEALTNLVNSHLKRKIGLTEFRNLGIVLIDFICDFNNNHNNELRIDTNLVAAWTKLYGSVLELVKRLEDQALNHGEQPQGEQPQQQ